MKYTMVYTPVTLVEDSSQTDQALEAVESIALPVTVAADVTIAADIVSRVVDGKSVLTPVSSVAEDGVLKGIDSRMPVLSPGTSVGDGNTVESEPPMLTPVGIGIGQVIDRG
jgi:hypothetical protein